MISIIIRMLKPGKTGHTHLNGSCVSPIKMPNILSNGGGGGVRKLNLQ